MIQRAGLGIVAALISAAIYGINPPLVRGAFDNGVPAVESSFFRTSVIALILGAVAFARGESLILPRSARTSFALLALATFGVSTCYLAAVEFIPVGLAVIIFYTFPVIVLLSAPMVEGHRPGAARIATAAFAFAGLAVAIGPGFDTLDMRGILLAGLAALSAALQLYSGRAMSRHIGPVAFASLVHLTIWLPALLLVVWLGNGTIRTFSSGMTTPMGYLGVIVLGLCYTAAYFFHMQSLRHAPASTVAPFFNLEPVVTTAVAALVLGERLDTHQYLGGLMVLLALIASSLLGATRAKG